MVPGSYTRIGLHRSDSVSAEEMLRNWRASFDVHNVPGEYQHADYGAGRSLEAMMSHRLLKQVINQDQKVGQKLTRALVAAVKIPTLPAENFPGVLLFNKEHLRRLDAWNDEMPGNYQSSRREQSGVRSLVFALGVAQAEIRKKISVT